MPYGYQKTYRIAVDSLSETYILDKNIYTDIQEGQINLLLKSIFSENAAGFFDVKGNPDGTSTAKACSFGPFKKVLFQKLADIK